MAIIRHQMMFLLMRERLNFGYRQSAMKRMSHLEALMVHRDNGVSQSITALREDVFTDFMRGSRHPASSQRKVALAIKAIPHFPVSDVLDEVVAPLQISDQAISRLFCTAPTVAHEL